MNYDRKKEADPLDTVEKARRILKELGIDTEETWKKRTVADGAKSHAFSVRLHADTLGMSTNGKGSDRSYALASAYGEFMERLQNMFLLPLDRVSREALCEGGFSLFPDERLLAPNEVCQAKDAFSQGIVMDYYRGSFLLACGQKEQMQVIADYKNGRLSADEKLIAWPFYSVKEDRVMGIWQNYIWMQGSNGMCAGNTPQEALVQGFSEIFERYAIAEILCGNAVPPDIPQEEYLRYDVIRALIDEIEAMGPYRILVKDCSLGKELPVCAALLMDTAKQRYRASFGSHPSRPVAIERCLTELLQGYDPADSRESDARLIPISRDCAKIDPYVNLLNMYSNGMGVSPYGFFADPPTYACAPAWDVSGEDNLQMLRRYVSLALILSDDVLIRDVSYLGFPAYMILLPGVSHPRVTRQILRRKNAFASLSDLRQYRGNRDERTLKALLAGLNMWENRSSRPALPIPVYHLKAAVLAMLGRLEEVPAYLEQYLPAIASQEERAQMSALALAVRLKCAGAAMEQIARLISAFYPAEVFNTLKTRWLCEDPLAAVLSSVPDKEEADEACSALLMRLKARFSQTSVSQAALGALLKR
ncbi:MAG: YcaO-like family protein [Clostridia bacterium]|nr:YcaO-like family protein [Clostridia bacterium]